MNKQEIQRLLALLGRLTRGQRQELADALKSQSSAEASIEVQESAGSQARACPHCKSQRLVRNGMADGLRRYKCRACGKTFNALTGTPLARLRHKNKWLEQTQAIGDGLTVHQAAQALAVAPSTAFRWRHRFLGVPRGVKHASLTGAQPGEARRESRFPYWSYRSRPDATQSRPTPAAARSGPRALTVSSVNAQSALTKAGAIYGDFHPEECAHAESTSG